MGCRDEWELSVVCPASNGQAQFTRDPAQWDEALLNLEPEPEREKRNLIQRRGVLAGRLKIKALAVPWSASAASSLSP